MCILKFVQTSTLLINIDLVLIKTYGISRYLKCKKCKNKKTNHDDMITFLLSH